MKALHVLPLVLLMTACSSVKNPLTPYRIDVQQGNALEQESVDKLKIGLNHSQVRFLLGTPLLLDPFHSDRWDYVFNYRKSGKLTEERRLVLFFKGDELVRIEAEGFEAKGEMPAANPAGPDKPVEKASEIPAGQAKPAAVAPTSELMSPARAETAAPMPAAETAKPAEVLEKNPTSAVETAPAKVPAAPAQPAPPSQQLHDETSIVQPLSSGVGQAQQKENQSQRVAEKQQESVALQTESNISAIKPDVMPEFPKAGNLAPASSTEQQVMAVLNAWVKAWKARDEEAYLAAYAASFHPEDGTSREEWEKRRRLLLGLARNIDVRIDGPAFEVVSEDHAQVSFRQFYSSDSYRDAVIKQLKFVRVDNLWLIEEERILAPIKVKK